MPAPLRPDLSARPHGLTVERVMRAGAPALYAAWTDTFDSWFGQPGETLMTAEVNRPFFFYNRHDWGRDAHYGRFLALEENRLVEMTWLTGGPGTGGAETVLRIELTPHKDGTHLKLTHTGFYDAAARDAHEKAWPEALDILDATLARQGAER